jgi:hypothetical protein
MQRYVLSVNVACIASIKLVLAVAISFLLAMRRNENRKSTRSSLSTNVSVLSLPAQMRIVYQNTGVLRNSQAKSDLLSIVMFAGMLRLPFHSRGITLSLNSKI